MRAPPGGWPRFLDNSMVPLRGALSISVRRPPSHLLVPPSPDRSDESVLCSLRRSDLALLAQGYHAAVRGRRQRVLFAIGLGGLLLAAVLIGVGQRLGWPESLKPVLLGAGLAVLLGALAAVTVRDWRARRRYAFQCPACHEYLVGGPRTQVDAPRAELAIATGNCPMCGAHILEPDV